MEEAGSQVVTPIVSYQNMVGRYCVSHPVPKKRSGLHYHPPNAANTSKAWSADGWDWDSARFIAKPSQCSEVTERTDRGASVKPESNHPIGEDVENLRENGETDSAEPQNASRPVKKARPGSPSGSGGANSNYPVCQVDACNENLSAAKDYHKRHKVCEVHSKAAEALVGKQTQRFCQQCSRFHPLAEFDEGKRSCRRRLAGHNRRRRKIHSEENNQPLLLPQTLDPNLGNPNLVNLLVALSHAQRNNRDTSISAPDKSQLIRFISSPNPSVPGALTASPQVKGSLHNNHVFNGIPIDRKNASPSTKDLLGVLTPTPSSEMQSSQTSTQGSDSEKSKSSSADESAHLNLHGGKLKEFPILGKERSSTACDNKTTPFLLLGYSSEDCVAKKSQTDLNLSLASNPVVTHDFFAIEISKEKSKEDDLPGSRGEMLKKDNVDLRNFCGTSLRLFGGSPEPGENCSFRSSPEQIEQPSTSGSNHSPSSLNSDSLDPTGRIIFKLFDKDPAQLPGSLRMQIYNWLSKSPSDMESHIRPGCILLSLYISMPTFAWDQAKNLLDYVKSLAVDIDAHFWGTARFLVYTDRQMASFNEGKTRLCRSWRTEAAPELISVSPLAVVRGQATSLLLKGRRLLTPGTKIHCTSAVGFCIRKKPTSCQGSVLDEVIVDNFEIIGGSASSDLGRCYIEVEIGLKGSSFPLIVADQSICDELVFLERDIEACVPDVGRWSREQALHFLHELGWLFQRKRGRFSPAAPAYCLARLKFLLIFSVDHDFPAVVKTLLDVLLELNLSGETSERESLEMLSEIHLLNRAVQQRSRSMATMLINYSVIDPADHSKKRYIFAPNVAGPGGLTPLHLAACLSREDELVDALTSDPLEV
ncbi:hypothetical protein M569_08937, partial [Genlisea aurea]